MVYKRFLCYAAAILTCGLFVFTSCGVDDNVGDLPYEEGIEEKTDINSVVNICKSTAYIRGVGNMPYELQQAVYQIFPNVVNDFNKADVAIVDITTVFEKLEDIADFYDRGGLIVCFFPSLKDILPESVGYTDLEGWDELLWAGNNRDDSFYMLNDPDEITVTDENGVEEKHALVKDQDYWKVRLDPLVDWIDYYKQEADNSPARTRAGESSELPTFDKLTVNMRNGAKRFECNFPFTLYHQIDKATGSDPDVLNKNGSVSLRFEVMPMYVGEVNGDEAGDYYAVRSTVIPHNDAVWGPFVGKHGWTRNRVYGYWFNTMDYKFTLSDPDANAKTAEGLRFAELPFPENSISSRNNKNGFKFGVNGSVAGGPEISSEGVKGKIEARVGFSAEWSDEVSYTLKNIDYARNTSSNWVNYHWHSNNVKLDDDMDDYEKYYPSDVHQEFNASNVWLWHVPAGSAGVKDESKKHFALAAYVKLNYSSWYHWRGTATFNGNRRNWDVDFSRECVVTKGQIQGNFSESGWAGCVFDLPVPNRSKWGLISLKNASNYTMRSVKIYASGEESKEPKATISNTYKSQELAQTAVGEGTYTVTFELINPDNNQVLKKGTLKDVKVKMGKNKEDATTSISTGDATLVDP